MGWAVTTSLLYSLVGQAAMIGFFVAYLVDPLTGLDVVGQTNNFICKAGLFVIVISVILLRWTEEFENLKKLARLPSMTSSGKHYGKTKLLVLWSKLERKFSLPSLSKFILSLCYKKLGLRTIIGTRFASEGKLYNDCIMHLLAVLDCIVFIWHCCGK